MIWILKERNYAVTEYYFSILKEAAEKISDDVFFVDEIDKNKCRPSSDIVIVGTVTKAIMLFLKGYKNVIIWFQGVCPEESYMRNKSIIRKKVLEFIEKKVLKRTKLAIFVSQAMKEHYENKYKINIRNKYYIMPCFNTEMYKESFFKAEKYEKNIFTYTGGLSSWQGFDKIIACYENIEKLGIPNTKLLVLTPDKDQALEEIEKTSIKNYEVGYAKVEELPSILSDVKFGFIIREDNIVNQVATPTKISNYIANGIIPIYSECIRDFHTITSDYKYRISFDSIDFYNNIRELMTNNINSESIYNEYAELFSMYYNADFHIKSLSDKFRQSILINEE